jgi:hypothetical protein
MPKGFSLTIRNRVAGVALAVAVVGIGIVLVTVGFALLAALALGGLTLGTAFGIYNRLRGGRDGVLRPGVHPRQRGLDPSLEISPDRPAIVRRVSEDASDSRAGDARGENDANSEERSDRR